MDIIIVKLLSETIKKEQNNTFKVLKESKSQPRILYLAKVSFKSEKEILSQINNN